MIEGKTISIIIPLYNEEKHIGKLINTLPQFIDIVILVNDSSTDRSLEEIKKAIIKQGDNKIEELIEELYVESPPPSKYYIVHHRKNKGKGAAIKSGYKLALELCSDCIATVDGDGQMDLRELMTICDPIILGTADYSKGNRLNYPNVRSIIPANRLLGIYVLTFLTRLCSGYWHINDTQTGFTAINYKTLRKINLDDVYDYYGYVNDIIVRLSAVEARIIDIPITPIYHYPLESKMNLYITAPKILMLMLRLFKWKLNVKLKSFLYNFQQN